MKTETKQYIEPIGFKGTKGEWRLSYEYTIHASRVGVVEGSKQVCDLNYHHLDKEVFDGNKKIILQSKELAKALQDNIQSYKEIMKDNDITKVLVAMGKHELMKKFAANYETSTKVLKDAGL